MNFSRYRISTRLGLAFGLVFLTMLLSAVVALINFSLLKHSVDEVVQLRMPAMAYSAEMKERAEQAIRILQRKITHTDPALMERERGLLLEARQHYDAAAQRLAALPHSAQERHILQQLELTLQTTRQLSDQILEHLATGRQQDAALMWQQQGRAPAQALVDKLASNIERQQALALQARLDAEATYHNGLLQTFGVAAFVALLAIGFAALTTRSITRQLGGEPFEAVALARNVAAGDLTTQIEVRARGYACMMTQLQTMQNSLAELVGGVRSSARTVAAASAELASAANGLSARTEEQASALEETSATMEQMQVAVEQSASAARAACELARGACEVAQRGGAVVAEVVQTMRGISESSQRIADIIGVIDGIAFQTNILALNAAVEAARAGEQGRGFAVVAAEVRSLAGRSAEAAREIKDLIDASVTRVGQGSALVDQAGATMTEVVQAIERAAGRMQEISATVQESDNGVRQVAQAVLAIDGVTQQNAALVEESAASADALQREAQNLLDLVSVFKLRFDAAAQEAEAAITLTQALPVRSQAKAGARGGSNGSVEVKPGRRSPQRQLAGAALADPRAVAAAAA